jgi:hypothetical protein
MTALINLWKPGIFKDRPGRRNPTVAALRAFQPRQRAARQRAYTAPKGARRLARKYGVIFDETTRLLGQPVPSSELPRLP